jgi:hypothetical protein
MGRRGRANRFVAGRKAPKGAHCMDNLLDSLKPQLDAMRASYQAGFEEGRRAAYREIAEDLQKLQTNFKNTRELTLSTQQGEINHGTQSRQT